MTATATHRKPEQLRAILGVLRRQKRAFQSIGPLTLMLIRLFSLDLSSMREIFRKTRQKTLSPGNFQDVSIKHHIDLIR